MQIFKDSSGREWKFSITLGTAMTIQGKLGIDLLQPEQGDPPLLTKLGSDDLLLARILCVLLEPQFEQYQMDEKAMYQAFDGATLHAAHTAFYTELLDFFRSRGRIDRVRAVEKLIQSVLINIETTEAKIAAIDVKTAVSGATSGEWQESLA